MFFAKRLIPSRFQLAFFISSGVLVGVVLFLVYISNFFSYLSDSPETCMNCHIMGPEYATWEHSSHRERATCNDCHVPHNNILNKYFFKAKDGMRHSYIFTLKQEPQAIIIKEEGAYAVQQNCKRCHAGTIQNIKAMMTNNNKSDGQERKCWECHRYTPHGKERSLSSTPFARVPTTKSMIPKAILPTPKNTPTSSIKSNIGDSK